MPPIRAGIDADVLLELWGTVVEDWQLDPAEVVAVLGWRHGGGALSAIGDLVQASRRLELLIEFAPIAEDVLGSQHAVREWLRRPSVHLGGGTPIQRMAQNPAWLRFLVDNLEAMP